MIFQKEIKDKIVTIEYWQHVKKGYVEWWNLKGWVGKLNW